MSDRRRRGEDEFADESPWPDDNPNDYRWAQDLAREAREEDREEERRGRHSAAPEAPGYPKDPYQPPGSQAPRGPVPPQAPRGPVPRRAPADPLTGHPSGPMPTLPAETYGRAARRAGPPADPRTGHPSGPMPTLPAETYGRGARRAGPPPAARPPRDPGSYPQDTGEPPGSRGRSGQHPPGDDYRRPGAAGRPAQPGVGYPPAGEPHTGPQQAYDPARDLRPPPEGRRAQAPRRDRPDRYPEPPSRRPSQPDLYAEPAARRLEPPARRGDPASPHGDPRGRRSGGRDGYGAPADRSLYQDVPGQHRDVPGLYQDVPGQHRDVPGQYQDAPGQRRDSQDPYRPAPGQPGGPADRRTGRTTQYPDSAPAPGRRGRGRGGPPEYGGGDAPGQGAGIPPGRPDRAEDGYPGDYRNDPADGDGFFAGLGGGEPPGRGRGRSRRGRGGSGAGGGGGNGGWDDGRGRPRKRGGRVAGLSAMIILLIIVVPLFVGGFFLYRVIESHYNPPNYSGDGTGKVIFQVVTGDSATTVANRLYTDGVVASARALVLAAEKSNNAAGLEPGFYRLHKHMSAAAAWALLLKRSSQVQLTVTIPEGWRVSQILAALGKDSGISLSAYQAAIKNTAALGLPSYAGGNPEGYLYPATYQIQPDANAAAVLKAMVTAFNSEAAGISLTQAAKAVHLTPAQVIVVASLAQAEAGKDSDMPKIAEVIYNRMAQHMPLDFDSTVMFALNTYGISASDQQLKVNSPYNTYAHTGLPPGPIDSPGNLAIQAALHPAHGTWLYFVDVNPKTKDTVFTSSETEFEQLKAELEHNLGK
ncbi:MAG TPA: endolytic transglycosylase MltG [Streptosporangiaceae bacterium]